MKKILLFFVVVSYFSITLAEFNLWEATEEEKKIFTFWMNICKNVSESDYPTIFVPWIAASWYSEYWYNDNKIKRWIPDPITHVYDTLFYTFKQNGYRIADVFYKNEFTVDIEGNPKQSLYLFWYDWKKDNKVTATILAELIWKILKKYEEVNGCDIWKVNIIAHSMGGLVSRAMMEDKCLKFLKNKNWIFELENYRVDKEWKISKFQDLDIGCSAINLNQQILVHKFITIWTPHRGSPKTLPTWEKWDISFADGFWFELGIWTQLSGAGDRSIYKKIHWYDPTIPNWIIGLWQLLPDISKDSPYNEKLSYLKKGTSNIPRKAHPRNSFLEDLNTTENIKKIFSKVDSYTSYYSKVTGSNGTNNIYQIELGDTALYNNVFSKSIGKPDIYLKDETEKYTGKDIYDYYKNEYESMWIFSVYNVKNAIRNEIGLWGDGTVPSQNLLLVPNDSKTWEEITDKKFQSKEIKCYQENWEQEIWKQKNKNISINPSFISIGDNEAQAFQVCQHIYMPTATSQKVIADILWKPHPSQKEENLNLLMYNGFTNYFSSDNWLWYGIKNSDSLEVFFEDIFYKKPAVLKENLEVYLPLDFTQKTKVFRYDILSPINVLITDEQWRKIWIDPQTGRIINEIPWAWTSGDTEGSNEPEFFLIPQTGTGKVQHSIQTFGTGDGVYHIEMREIEKDQTAKKVLTIQGNATQGFESDYRVEKKQKWGTQAFSYTPTSNFPAKIETVSNTFTTDNESFTLRYFLKGDGKKVSKLQVQTLSPSGKKETTVQSIKGKIDIACKEFWDYTVTLTLLDAQWNILKHIWAKKTLTITRPEPQKTLPDDEYIYIDIPTDGIPFGIYVPKKSR